MTPPFYSGSVSLQRIMIFRGQLQGELQHDKFTGEKILEIKRLYDSINIPSLRMMVMQNVSQSVPFFHVYEIYGTDCNLDRVFMEDTLTAYFQRRLSSKSCYVEIPKVASNFATVELHIVF